MKLSWVKNTLTTNSFDFFLCFLLLVKYSLILLMTNLFHKIYQPSLVAYNSDSNFMQSLIPYRPISIAHFKIKIYIYYGSSHCNQTYNNVLLHTNSECKRFRQLYLVSRCPFEPFAKHPTSTNILIN
jgi:hypothetical protein